MKTEQKELTFIEIEAKGFQDLCNKLADLEQENQSLRLDNDFLQRQNAACKLRCGKLAIQVKELESEIADMKFTHKMLNSEEAGRAFARELLGGA